MPTLATSLLLIVLAIPSLAQRCTSQTITVNVNAITSILNLQEPANQKSLTDFVQQSTSPTLNFPATLIQGTQPLSKSYIISGKLCVPAQGVRKSGTLLFATHGIAFTHGYWEAGGPGSEFNFASSTTAAGNSIFYYDRLGVGSSSKPDGIKEVQSTVQVEIAHLLIEHLKSTGSFKRVVGIGHSFGSILTTGVAAKYPGDFNDIILTGFAGGDQVGILVSMASFGATIASPLLSGVNPSSSYFTVGTFSNFQMGVLKFPFFDSRVAQAQFEGRGTATLGEIATLSLPASAPATEFSGRVLVVTGMEDAFFCAGNCAEVVNGVTLPNVVAGLFPATSGFSSYVTPNTGHALNYHFSASSTFAFIQNWLDS